MEISISVKWATPITERQRELLENRLDDAVEALAPNMTLHAGKDTKLGTPRWYSPEPIQQV